MKMRLGPLLGIGIGYLIGTGKAKDLIGKAKQSLSSRNGSGSSSPRPYAPPMGSGTTPTSGSSMTAATSAGSGNATSPAHDASIVVPAGISGTASPTSLLEP